MYPKQSLMFFAMSSCKTPAPKGHPVDQSSVPWAIYARSPTARALRAGSAVSITERIPWTLKLSDGSIQLKSRNQLEFSMETYLPRAKALRKTSIEGYPALTTISNFRKQLIQERPFYRSTFELNDSSLVELRSALEVKSFKARGAIALRFVILVPSRKILSGRYFSSRRGRKSFGFHAVAMTARLKAIEREGQSLFD